MGRMRSVSKIVSLSSSPGHRSFFCSSAWTCLSDRFQAQPGAISRSYSHATADEQNVGVIGLGNMGSHMAFNLLKAGHTLFVHDRNDAAMQSLVEKGASKADSPKEIAERSDVVITMLPASSHVEEVYTGSNGLLSSSAGLRPSVLIDCSTIDPQTSRTLATKVGTCRLSASAVNIGSETPVMLDAPVSGGVGGASAASLTFMVGGPETGLKAALPLFNVMGKRVVHCGGPGTGSAAKLCNNLAMAISMAGVSEAFALGQRLGIDSSILSNIFNSSSARCWSSDTYNPVPGVMDNVPASRDYKGGFSCQLLAKDLGLALVAAKETGSHIPLTKQVYEMYSNLCQKGYNHEDFSNIFQRLYEGEPLHAEDKQPAKEPLAGGTQ
ncbi:hypothetical protein R1sor_020712 [Riccia sorocarpa]|uniref:3-hydroxyisobutyrate dehydrogenase n=1 Tax=Riccia sorocarpa TaxID=122646 RepID=A0ABD3GIM4_9MARC